MTCAWDDGSTDARMATLNAKTQKPRRRVIGALLSGRDFMAGTVVVPAVEIKEKTIVDLRTIFLRTRVS
jgi:hypothetical protein